GRHDPVAERHPADRERAEQVDLGHLPVVVGPGRAAVGRGLLRLVGGVMIHRSVSTGAFVSGAGARYAAVRIGKRRPSPPCHSARSCRRPTRAGGTTGANRADLAGGYVAPARLFGASRTVYERAPVPASFPPATIRYSSRIGLPASQHSRISRVP